jgi:hypothetical protein
MIRQLHEKLNIPTDVLIQAYWNVTTANKMLINRW